MGMGDERLIVFDLGGVVVRICRSWGEGVRAAGLDERPILDEESDKQRRRKLSYEYQCGRMTCDDYFVAIADGLGGAYSPAEVERVHDAWILGEYPEIASLVRGLLDGGRALGVLSNTSHSHWGSLVTMPAIEPIVERRHASHLLGLCKPDPAIYRAFEHEAGWPGERIVFFDDLPENVEAAKAAGWDAVRIDHEGHTAEQIRGALSDRGLGAAR